VAVVKDATAAAIVPEGDGYVTENLPPERARYPARLQKAKGGIPHD
jgi:hypothetical protein